MIGPYYSSASWRTAMLGSFADLRQSLDAESLKLASGKKATNYAGLGSEATTSLKLHNRLDSIGTFSSLISSAQTEINFTAQSLTTITTLLDNVHGGTLSLAGGSDKIARTTASSTLGSQFSSLISYLRTQGPSGYIFGGSIDTNPPVIDSEQMLNGSAGKAGLIQLFNERFAADAGASGLGRLNVLATGNQVSISEEAAGLPFGLKLSTIESGLSNASVVQASGTPPTESITFTGQPANGDLVSFKFNLPDGSTSSITLRAASTAAEGQFAIGATPADTATNLQNALKTSIASLVSSDLYAASAAYTAKNFFASDATHPPERVSGSTPSTATTVIFGTTANTVTWYTGKTDSSNPRQDRSITISDDVSIDFGVRANETGLQSSLAGIASALLVAQNFSATEATAQNQMTAIRQRARQITSSGKTDVQAMIASVAASQNIAKQVADQNSSIKGLLQARLSSLEDVNSEESAATISTLTTQLQASYQVASKLLNLSLSAYL